MHSDSFEPSEGAALPVSRPLCKCHGKPCYPNAFTHGRQRWRCAIKAQERNRVAAVKNAVAARRRSKEWALANPDRRREQSREYRRRKLGWYEPDGMATKPTQFKELTNE